MTRSNFTICGEEPVGYCTGGGPGHTGVRKYVANLIGLTQDQFRSLVVAFLGKIEADGKMTPETAARADYEYTWMPVVPPMATERDAVTALATWEGTVLVRERTLRPFDPSQAHYGTGIADRMGYGHVASGSVMVVGWSEWMTLDSADALWAARATAASAD